MTDSGTAVSEDTRPAGEPATTGAGAAAPRDGRQPDRPDTGADTRAHWLDEDQQRAWRAYLLGTARVTDALNRQLESDVGISLSEYEILVRLSEVPDHAIRMSDLAVSVMHSRSRLTHTVSRMERRGLVRRESCAQDGRGVNCVMTDEGREFLTAAAPGHVTAVRTNLVDLLDDADFRALGRIMARVAEGPDDEATAG